MKDLKNVMSELTYSRIMQNKWERKANRLEKCADCIARKLHKECPSDCAYLER